MIRRLRFLLFFLLPGALLAADAPDAVAAKLREGLRNTLLQLRDAQTQLAAAQAAQADSETQKAALQAKFDALVKQDSSDRDAAEKKIAGLGDKISDADARIAQLKTSLDKWEAAYRQADAVGRAKEAERAKLAAQVITLQRTVDQRDTQNLELYKTGNEILTRYEKFGLGEALLAREPFTGVTRVKLQTLVQDYKDKLLDQKSKP